MNTYLRVFGSGPFGVLLTIGLLGLTFWFQGHHPTGVLGIPSFLRYLILTIATIGNLLGVIWSFRSLPVAQRGHGLCVQGAYRWVRHPLYASFISIGAPGLAIFFNYWIGLLWVVALHLLWHLVISIEERSMLNQFGEEYSAYASHTGRFFPRLFHSRGRA